jgi:Major Facilitator Superfamily
MVRQLSGTAIFGPTQLEGSARRKIFLYLALLTVLAGYGAPHGGLIYIPISFILKNKLQLNAHELADFRLLVGLPLYFAVVFGLARDILDPFGMKDRGFLFIFGLVSATIYLLFAFLQFNYVLLTVSFMLLTGSYLFIASAIRGLMTTVGQQHLLTGQVSTVWTVFALLPSVTAVLLGGQLSQQLEYENLEEAARIVFLTGSLIMMAVAGFSTLKPSNILDQLDREREWHLSSWIDIKKLVHHRPIYPALLISLLWYFMPGVGTPLQYYFQNTLGGTDAQWGEWNAIADASCIPALLAFGYLCRKVALRQLLFWGTLIGILQMIPLLLMPSVTGALIAAIPFGLLSGFATVAFLDLTIRSCPRGLQGTVLMAFYCLENVASRFSDVVGTRLYDYWGGFPACVAAASSTSALILPLLLLVPTYLTARPDEPWGISSHD